MSNIDEIYYIEENSFADPWTKEMLESEISNKLSVLETETQNGILCGFALGRVVADEAELFKIAVLQDFRRQGIAEKLLSKIHGQMHKNGAVVCFLEVRSKNIPAVKLYEKSGYQRVRVIKGYYPDDDAIVLRREL